MYMFVLESLLHSRAFLGLSERITESTFNFTPAIVAVTRTPVSAQRSILDRFPLTLYFISARKLFNSNNEMTLGETCASPCHPLLPLPKINDKKKIKSKFERERDNW